MTYRTEYTYTNETVEVGETYDYPLADVSYDGVKEYHSMTVLGVNVTEPMPTKFTMYPAYPNPFNPATVIDYDLPEQSHVTLLVYDVTAREDATLVNGLALAGIGSAMWNGKRIGSHLDLMGRIGSHLGRIGSHLDL